MMANDVDPDQTAPLGVEEQSDVGLHCLLRLVCPKIWDPYIINIQIRVWH